MDRVSSSLALGLSLAAALTLPVGADGAGTSKLANTIAFLRSRAVWVAEADGSGARKLTAERTGIDAFLFSPDLRYLAYTAVVGSAALPWLQDRAEAVPRRSTCAVMALDLETGRTFKAADAGWFDIIRWLPGDRLFFCASDGFAVTGYSLADVPGHSVRELASCDERTMGSDFSRDGSLEAYVDDSGRDLHLVRRDTGSDALLVSGKGNITDVRISNDKKTVAFLQVEAVERVYSDILWLYDRESASCLSLYRGPSHSKSGSINCLAWSPDDRYIGMLFSPQAIILDVRDSGQAKTIRGENPSWIAKDELIVNRRNDLFVHDLATGADRLLVKDATGAVFLR